MARPVEPEPLAGPVRFGPYTLARRIGAGGMGEVFLAREEAPRRACVVKKVLPQLMASPQFVGRFRDEARVVVRLQHPNIARVYAMGEEEGQLYLAMEYVQGKTLSRLTYRLRQLGKMMPLGILLHLGERLCEGLAYAHDATDEEGHPLHLVHRDLSPANICLSYAGEVKVIDFGAAQSTLKEQQTAPRVVIGNLTYMSPEQARKRFVDRRADLYAVGALLWELSAWKPLSQRGDPVERWRRAAYPQWEPAGRYRQGLPTSVDAFLVRALASEPGDRFPDAAAMGAELARLKAKLAPGVGDADVARLMALVFPREKKAEEALLRELLREEGRARTDPQLAAALVPPTALAFEHSAVITPDDFIASERAQVGPPPGGTDSTPTQAMSAGQVQARITPSAGDDSAATQALSAEQLRARVGHGADATRAPASGVLRAPEPDAPTLALSAEQLRARLGASDDEPTRTAVDGRGQGGARDGEDSTVVEATRSGGGTGGPGEEDITRTEVPEGARSAKRAEGTQAPVASSRPPVTGSAFLSSEDEPTAVDDPRKLRAPALGASEVTRGSGDDESTAVESHVSSVRVVAPSSGLDDDESTAVGPRPDGDPRHVEAPSSGLGDDESTAVEPRAVAARTAAPPSAGWADDESTAVGPRTASPRVAASQSPGLGDDESTAVGPRTASPRAGALPSPGPGDDETTAVDSPLRRGRTSDHDASPPLGADGSPAGTTRYGAQHVESRPKPPPDETEALDAAKVLVAIAEATVRPSGAKESLYPGPAESTVTPTMEGTRYATSRRVPRETQVGFGVDISQTVDTAAIEAKRLELVRAITGDDELPVAEPPRTGSWLQGPRLWLAAALFAGACLLGLSVVWWLWR
ncbi:protein kinase [Myxococcus stipitatus]|uniref:serine/threonine protein kinase n=1 Tax=Myxococcus stipitatus TaxID=83455 RepID=UPI001F476924|nr:serine/threonine protein kinase [Myxococcus stipitatus]MCE9668925.1 protein kinase [Myxococcus stipitatus]